MINVGHCTHIGTRRGPSCGGCAAKAAGGSINHFLRLCRKEPLNAGISEICRERGKSAFQTPRLPGVDGRGAAKEAAAASWGSDRDAFKFDGRRLHWRRSSSEASTK